MKLKQSVNLLLVALFLWAFQSTTIHFQHNAINQVSECTLCQTTGKMDLSHNNSSIVIVYEHIAVQSTKRVVKIVLNSRFDYTDVFEPTEVHRIGEQLFFTSFLPLGFNTTAPPTLI